MEKRYKTSFYDCTEVYDEIQHDYLDNNLIEGVMVKIAQAHRDILIYARTVENSSGEVVSKSATTIPTGKVIR